ncbi:hypothetical protein SGQ44_11035 [Flavobacterium sp. Fl-77]|uniref:DoxX family protein n=1 Tax=Flavobacterium flavipigmentatum TaxID=2893884 RepID=A0AAJ2VWW7_9FLAO|nr:MULTISPECIES: hypothetical protein [unclassified Flavobacterium]MDX6182844.1 hypothetical protein [Flavobacterium sp. Fl-33]MDX6186297.1 hypothetical protein [Flavobacterium sp. Fl-77]UFH37914.1 hypothetical protein LNP22_14365 [Flavobacterium sp. F-70]
MKPLLVLLSVFVLSLLVTKIGRGNFEFALSGRIAMAAMLAFTAIAHFVFTKGMAMMLPDFVPYKIQLVYITGVIEIVAAFGLFITGLRPTVAWLLIVFFILLLPANIYAAIKHIDYQKANLQGNAIGYLWFRIPLQIVFIVWTYLSAIKS